MAQTPKTQTARPLPTSKYVSDEERPQTLFPLATLSVIKNSSQSTNSRYIPIPLKRQIWKRDNACCSYIHPQTRKRCNSKYFLQIDHIQPHSLNGLNELNNLRLVCQAHNLRYALNTFGVSKIKSYIASTGKN